MALSNKDIERIGEIMAARMAAELKPIETTMHMLTQTVYGESGNNGLRKSVKDLVKWKYMATGALFIVGSATFWKILSTL